MRHATPTRCIGFLLFDGLAALDLVGPMDAFAAASAGKDAYELVSAGPRRHAVTAESGLVFKPDVALSDCPRLDTLVVPGGSGLRRLGTNATIAAWIAQRAPAMRRVASVCTGIFGLAPTGLLDGRNVTTHWRYASELARCFGELRS